MSLPVSARSNQRQCEVLGELFTGPAGVASVGRMLRGTELGRLVFLRGVPDASLGHIKSFIDTARCVAHPSLLKVIGRVETPDTIYVASEYISGVSLLELVNFAISREQRIETAVAVRIIRDALQAADKAKQLFRENTGTDVRRCIFPDTVWIAEFGEIMLTEVGVASTLSEAEAEAGDDPIVLGDADVIAAGTELLKLLTNQPLEEAEMTLPISGDLASIVARAVNPSASNRFKSAAEMSEALSALPSDLLADERTVGDTVRKLMASVLAVRHPRRLMSVAAPTRPGGADATCVFRDSAEYSPSLAQAARSISDEPPRRTSSQPSPPARDSDRTDQHDINPSHPAYAFLKKHGLLEHAQGLMKHGEEGEDLTLVMPPRQREPSTLPPPDAPPPDGHLEPPTLPPPDELDDPTQLMSTRRSARPRPALVAPPQSFETIEFDVKTEQLDPEFLRELAAEKRGRKRALVASLTVVVLAVAALLLFT